MDVRKNLLRNLLSDTNFAHLRNLDSQLVKGKIITSILTKHKIIQLKNREKNSSQHKSVTVRVTFQKLYSKQI